MPFTPFHVGAGLLAKSIAPRHISVVLFASTQVAIDIEPLVRMVRGDTLLHGWTHTFVGAVAVSALVGLLFRSLSGRSLRYLVAPVLPWSTIAITTVLGGVSHVLLDAWVHHDMAFRWPRQVTLDQTHLACSGMAMAALLIYSIRLLTKGAAEARVAFAADVGSVRALLPESHDAVRSKRHSR